MLRICNLILIVLLMCMPQFGWAKHHYASSSHKKPIHSKHVVKKKKVHLAKHQKKLAKHHPKKKHTQVANQQPVNISPPEKYADLNSNKMAELTQSPSDSSTGMVAAIQQRLVNFVEKTVSNLQYSSYKLGGSKIDTSHGIYIVDCSGYVDHSLRAVFPKAYLSLVNSSGSDKPNSSHYYDFFKGLSQDTDQYWSKVEDIQELDAGDILVFRYKNNHRNTGGHVMVVMDKPVQDGNDYYVSVADSAPSGHSEDTRQRHVSGIGIGTLLLKVNPKTGQPSAYAWKVGSRWKNNVNFAMARPLEINS